MTLQPGVRLGSFEIVALVGVGGMGEVYRARDTKLNRDVAVKVLPDSLAFDADRLTRFKREAQLLASLNHSNIAQIYGFEESDGVHALVMELVEGPTLADMIAGSGLSASGSGPASRPEVQSPKPTAGGLPLQDALNIARQLAEALEAAHEQGIIHRDLKPANIKVRDDGTVKVLDFGLAKAVDPAPTSVANASMSPTLSVHATMAGVILGTAAYMSPEQARGKPVDKRTDTWAFGCVLYEMLTGRGCFDPGETVSDAIVAILKNEPDWNALPEETPPNIRTLLRRCLQKDPQKRLPHIGVARLELDDAAQVGTSNLERGDKGASIGATKPRFSRWIAAAVLVGAAAAFAVSVNWRPVPPDTRIFRTSVVIPAELTISLTPLSRFALSPDGRQLVFSAASADGIIRLHLRSLDDLSTHVLNGSEAGGYPCWSPDSRTIAFTAQGRLKRIDLAGGPAVTISETSQPGGCSWNRNGVILFSSTTSPAVQQISSSGPGQSSPVTTLDADQGDRRHLNPFFLPDGRHFLFCAVGSKTGGAGEARAIFLGSLDPGEKSRLLVEHGGSNAKYGNGYLVFLRGTTLVAQRFDERRLTLVGAARPLAEQIAVGGQTGAGGAFWVTDTGVLAYQNGFGGGVSQLTWFDRAGKVTSKVDSAGDYLSVELSPDGTRVATSVLEPSGTSRDLWIYDLNHEGLRTQLTFGTGDEAYPVWSPDGTRLVYASRGRDGRQRLYEKSSNGSGKEELLFDSPLDTFPYSWSLGHGLSYNSSNGSPQTGADIWTLPMVGERKPSLFLQTPFNEGQGRFSPDGRWILYVSNQAPRSEVWVAPFPPTGAKWRVSTTGGTWPRWRRDGREIFFLGLDGKVMAVDVNAQSAAFALGTVHPLFDTRSRVVGGQLIANYSSYDVSSDGQRFLVNAFVEDPRATSITLVVNWTELLNP